MNKKDLEEEISWACLYEDEENTNKIIYFNKSTLFFVNSIYTVSDIFESYLKKISNKYRIDRIFNLININHLFDELNLKKIDIEKIDTKDIF